RVRYEPQHNRAIGARGIERPHESLDAADQHVVAEVEHEGVIADEVAANERSVCDPGGRLLTAVREPRAEPAAIAHLCVDLWFGIAHYQREVANPRLNELANREVEHRRVRDRDKLLRARLRERAQTAPFVPREDDAFHVPGIIGTRATRIA